MLHGSFSSFSLNWLLLGCPVMAGPHRWPSLLCVTGVPCRVLVGGDEECAQLRGLMWKVLAQVLPLPSPPPTPFTIGVPAERSQRGSCMPQGPQWGPVGPRNTSLSPAKVGTQTAPLRRPAPSPLLSELLRWAQGQVPLLGQVPPLTSGIISYLNVLEPPASELVLGSVCCGTWPFRPGT